MEVIELLHDTNLDSQSRWLARLIFCKKIIVANDQILNKQSAYLVKLVY